MRGGLRTADLFGEVFGGEMTVTGIMERNQNRTTRRGCSQAFGLERAPELFRCVVGPHHDEYCRKSSGRRRRDADVCGGVDTPCYVRSCERFAGENGMHIPDGFINLPVSAGAGVVAASAIGYALHRVNDDIDERQIPLTGLVAAFIFAAQMVNFPVAAGTSGHLMGALLAAVLVGPWLGMLAMTVVVSVQALLFADGGISALGLNLVNMAVIPTLVGYVVFLAVRHLLPDGRSTLVAATGVAALVSVVVTSLGFVAEYALGGYGGASVLTVGVAMVGVHVLIGVGEAIISMLTVGFVVASRPDLVHGAPPAASLGPATLRPANT